MKMNKSIFTMIGIAALAAVIGLVLAGCPADSDGGDSGGGTMTAKVKVNNNVNGSTITKLEFFNSTLYGTGENGRQCPENR